jgi:hypothetical protein
MEVRELGRVSEWREVQPWKALLPIEWSEFGRVTEVREEQFRKALFEIPTTLTPSNSAGITNL